MKLFLDEEPGRVFPFAAYVYTDRDELKLLERFSTLQDGYEFCEEYAAAHAHVGTRRVGEWDL